MKTFHHLWAILQPDNRREVVILLLLMIIGMILEMLGIGMIIPALAMMIESDLASKFPSLIPILDRLGNPTQIQLVIGGMLVLIVLYVIKVIFLAFLIWRQNRFVFQMQANISVRLFSGYLRQPYTFHLQHNSSQLIQNTIHETQLFALNGLSSVLTLVTEVLVLLGIFLLIMIVEPVGGMIIISILGVAGFGFSRLTRKSISRWGKARQLHEKLRIQHLQQGLGSAKDVKLLGREREFIRKYRIHNTMSTTAGKWARTLMALPRLWIELLAVTGLVGLVISMIMMGKPLETLVPLLGLFALAAFRMMPSVNRITVAVQSLRYALPAIELLSIELDQFEDVKIPQPISSNISFSTSLEFDQVSFKYPQCDEHALQNINLTIKPGAFVGFVGESGAGKSTLIDVMLGLLKPSEGTVLIDNVDIQSNLRSWQDQIGYVPQSIYLTDDSLRRNVAFGIADEEIDEDAVLKSLSGAQLENFVKDLPEGVDTIMGERGIRLSGGQRQRIGIARALYHNPSVLVLDEATSALDSITESEFMEAVKNLHEEKTVIIIAHRLSTVKYCEWIYELAKGQIIEMGEVSKVLEQADNKNKLNSH